MKRFAIGSLIILALSLGGCVVAPYGRPRYYAPAVAVVAPVPVIRVRVYP